MFVASAARAASAHVAVRHWLIVNISSVDSLVVGKGNSEPRRRLSTRTLPCRSRCRSTQFAKHRLARVDPQTTHTTYDSGRQPLLRERFRPNNNNSDALAQNVAWLATRTTEAAHCDSDSLKAPLFMYTRAFDAFATLYNAADVWWRRSLMLSLALYLGRLFTLRP